MTIRLAIGQIEPRVDSPQQTIDAVKRMLKEASDSSVDVLVLPELANSGYAFNSVDEAFQRSEPVPSGPFCTLLREWSRDGRVVVAGVCERHGDELYNSAVAMGDGNHLATYRKIHLFAREKEYFRPGNEEPPVFESHGHRFGIMICFDWAFPEVARILALRRAQVILHPSNLCQRVMTIRSLENGVFTATTNRVGQERSLRFTGLSQITDTRGNVLVNCPPEGSRLAYADIDPHQADDKMLTEYNDRIRDRRPELYGLLTRRHIT